PLRRPIRAVRTRRWPCDAARAPSWAQSASGGCAAHRQTGGGSDTSVAPHPVGSETGWHAPDTPAGDEQVESGQAELSPVPLAPRSTGRRTAVHTASRARKYAAGRFVSPPLAAPILLRSDTLAQSGCCR